MNDLTTFVNPWGWLVLAAVLAGVEIVAPGAFMIWLAAAALVTAGVALLGVGVPWQLAAFALAALLAILASRRIARRNPIDSDDPALNRRGARMVGDTVRVVEPIVAGRGKVLVGDSPWSAVGPDAPLGATLTVLAVEGTVVTVGHAGPTATRPG